MGNLIRTINTKTTEEDNIIVDENECRRCNVSPILKQEYCSLGECVRREMANKIREYN